MIVDQNKANDDLDISPTLFKNKKLCSFEEDNNTTMLSSQFNNTQILGAAPLDTSIFSNQTSLFQQSSQPVVGAQQQCYTTKASNALETTSNQFQIDGEKLPVCKKMKSTCDANVPMGTEQIEDPSKKKRSRKAYTKRTKKV